MPHSLIAGLLLAGVTLAGCHGTLDTLQLPDMAMEPAPQASRSSVAVAAFQDRRSDTEQVGVHIKRTGSRNAIRLKDDTLGPAVTRGFIHFLNQSGFSAAADTDAASADFRIEADITHFKANVTDRLLYSLIEVDATMIFMIHNAADGRTMRVTVGAGETLKETFFNQRDVEELINVVLKKGFVKLLKTAARRGGTLT